MRAKAMAYCAVMSLIVCLVSAGLAQAATEAPNVTLFGNNAGSLNSGFFVTFIGDSAGSSSSGNSGVENTFIGDSAGLNNTGGSFNTFLGAFAGNANADVFADDNTFIGDGAGASNIDGFENTFVGSLSGSSNNGSGNVFLGFEAGSDELGSSNKLFIDNCHFSDVNGKCIFPLIYGEFDNRIVAIDGSLGIGTTSPAVALEVSSSGATNRGLFISQTSNDSNAAVFKIRKSRGAGAILSGDFIANYGFMGFDGTSFGDAGRIRTFAAENWTTTAHGATMVFENVPPGTVTAVEHMRITGTGNVGIGTTNPINPLQMGSGAFVSAGGVWTNASSREYKENIRELTTADAVKTLEGLNPVKYNYKADAADKHVGFIAEDVPDLVASKDRKGLSPMDIVAVLTKVVQEQAQKLARLEAEVNRLKSKDMTARAIVQ